MRPLAAFSLTLVACLAGPAVAADLSITLRGQSGAPIQDAAVLRAAAVAPPTAGAALIDQIDKRFEPSVSLVRTGTAITFPNKDNIRHHVYSFSSAKTCELKLYSGVPAEPVVFDQAGLIVLGCNIHDGMLAYVYVVDTPLARLSDAAGIARIPAIAAGQYQLEVWHPRLPAPAILNAGLAIGTTALSFEQVLTLEPDPQTPPPLE